MFLLLIVFIVVPILELFVIIKVGGAIGVLPTIGLLILDSLVGAALLRSQGRAVWARFNTALAESRVPAREVFDGALVIFGAALLMTPGFLTDILGLILLIPPTRAVVRGILSRTFAGRIARGGSAVFWTVRGAAGSGRSQPGGPPPQSHDYEGTARDVTEPPHELPGGSSNG